jgi:hypothetical protein
MKIRPMGGELFNADRERERERRTDGRTDGRTKRQTDVTKLIVGFRIFANAPENDKIHPTFKQS